MMIGLQFAGFEVSAEKAHPIGASKDSPLLWKHWLCMVSHMTKMHKVAEGSSRLSTHGLGMGMGHDQEEFALSGLVRPALF